MGGAPVRDSHTIVGWDKDSTLALTTQRRRLIPDILAGKRAWIDYSRACADDEPVEAAHTLMRLLSAAGHWQVIMSGATDCQEALNWLDRHHFPYDRVRMRGLGDETDNALLKVQWIKEYHELGHWVVLFVEDDPEAAEVIRRETGVPVLVLNPCYAEELAAVKALRIEGRHGAYR